MIFILYLLMIINDYWWLLLTVLQWLLCHRVCLKKTTWLSVKGSPVSPACHINFNNSWSLESVRQIEVDVQFKLMEPDKLHVCLYVPEMKTADIWDPVFCPEEEICVVFFFLNLLNINCSVLLLGLLDLIHAHAFKCNEVAATCSIELRSTTSRSC